MNLKKVKAIIEFYKKNFHDISNMEIYKWRAVKHFQESWDIETKDFAEMLENSLGLTGNLLTSLNYYPRRMMIQYAELDSEAVRKLFRELYREDYESERDIGNRFNDFRLKTEALNEAFFATQKHREMYAEKDGLSYQRHNAFMVYLSLRFPDRFFFYKFGEFKRFVEKIESLYKPKKGANENLRYYLRLCERLRDEIAKDAELISLHRQRLTENEYEDESLNILTQDVIYAAVNHFNLKIQQR